MGLPQIIPPRLFQVEKQQPLRTNISVPTVNVGGPLMAGINTWTARQGAKVANAVATFNDAKTRVIVSETGMIDAEIRFKDRMFQLAATPQRLANEFAILQVGWANDLRGAQHNFEREELNRSKEIAMGEAERNQARVLRTHSQTALIDAEQQLQAQIEFGSMHYVVAHKKQVLEAMDIELDMEERKALLKNYLAKGTEQPAARTDDDATEAEIDDALEARRQQLNAAGLDTTKIDAAIKARRK